MPADPREAVLEVTGGGPLCGEVAVSGAKNAALPILAASILASEPVWVRNVPELADVATLLAILEELGIAAYRDARGTFCLETRDSRPVGASYDLIRKMRAGICVLGPLLARRGRAEIPLPGGCVIGDRPIDLHLSGLRRMGAKVRLHGGMVIAEARRLRGAVLSLRGPHGSSVTGTANLLMAATLAEGTTTLKYAAREPEIVDLGRFLTAMGARIQGLGSNTIRIEGVKRLAACDFEIIPDRIEAATLLLAGAITRGRVRVRGARAEHLKAVLKSLRQAGIRCDADEHGVAVSPGIALGPVSITAGCYPGFPTDLQAQWTALMSVAPGRATVQDRVFPERFRHAAELRRLGARVFRATSKVVIQGSPSLRGAEVVAPDLRAGAALILAGLAAEGRTRLHGVELVDRGYQRLDEKLASLGGDLRRAAPAEADPRVA